MSKPKYNAYKPLLMTDGVQTWTRHDFDNTKAWTKDVVEEFKRVMSDPHLHPIGRIEIMQARLDALEKITPAMQIHIDAIRTIHANFLAKDTRTLESLDALEKQDEHWLKILLIRDVLPLARKKVKANADALAASKRMRPKARSPFKEAVSTAMLEGKKRSQDFKTFMQMWGLGDLRGMTLEATDGGDRYLINDENGDLGTKTYAWGTLEKMYSQLE